jgi:hypothetical protein
MVETYIITMSLPFTTIKKHEKDPIIPVPVGILL